MITYLALLGPYFLAEMSFVRIGYKELGQGVCVTETLDDGVHITRVPLILQAYCCRK